MDATGWTEGWRGGGGGGPETPPLLFDLICFASSRWKVYLCDFGLLLRFLFSEKEFVMEDEVVVGLLIVIAICFSMFRFQEDLYFLYYIFEVSQVTTFKNKKRGGASCC